MVGDGDGNPGAKGAGRRKAGEESLGGKPDSQGGRKQGEFRNIASYFAIEKAQRGGNHKGRGGKRDYKVREVQTTPVLLTKESCDRGA